MITEKVTAFSEAHAVASAALLAGSVGPRAARRMLTVCKRKVRTNTRRLWSAPLRPIRGTSDAAAD
jgi:hypothetical protein